MTLHDELKTLIEKGIQDQAEEINRSVGYPGVTVEAMRWEKHPKKEETVLFVGLVVRGDGQLVGEKRTRWISLDMAEELKVHSKEAVVYASVISVFPTLKNIALGKVRG